MPPQPLTIADIDPGRVYPLAAYAQVMMFTQRTAQNHVKVGHLKAVRVGRRGHFRVLGAEIIRVACRDQAQPQPSETAAERRARAKADGDLIRRLARAK